MILELMKHSNQNLNRLIFMMLVIILVIMGCQSKNSSSDKRDRFESVKLDFSEMITFTAPKGDLLAEVVMAIADNEETRTLGLMNVTDLPENGGMLFVFDDEIPRSFWMANTPLSLDLIFVNSNGEIVTLLRDAEAYSTKSYSSNRPAKYVIEVNAGFTVSHDIKTGDLVKGVRFNRTK